MFGALDQYRVQPGASHLAEHDDCMRTIDRITLREIRLALKEPFRISSGVMQERRIALLELTDQDGATAWSECVAFQLPIYTAETIDTAWLALREWLAPRILGRDLEGPEVVHALLEENIRGHNMAKAALEMGVWGLAAEAQDVPLSVLLGGTRSRIPTGISLGIQSEPAALVAQRLAEVEVVGVVGPAQVVLDRDGPVERVVGVGGDLVGPALHE